MIHCSFCNEEIDRNVFCSKSCKTRFHRGDKKELQVAPPENPNREDSKKIEEAVNEEYDFDTFEQKNSVQEPEFQKVGYCEAHFEKGVTYKLRPVEFKDANDYTVFKGDACEKCIKAFEAKKEGEVVYADKI